MEEIDQLAKVFEDSLSQKSLSKLNNCTDDLTVAIGDAISNGIPFFAVAQKLYKASVDFRFGRFVKKVGHFLLNAKEIPLEDRQTFLKELDKSMLFKDHGSEILLEIIDNLDSLPKVDIMTNLLKNKVLGKIDLADFLRLCNTLQKVSLIDLQHLKEYEKDSFHGALSESLESAGLVSATIIGAGGYKFRLNNVGKMMLEFGL